MTLGDFAETHRSNSKSLTARFAVEVKKHSKSQDNSWGRGSQICVLALISLKDVSVSVRGGRRTEPGALRLIPDCKSFMC